MRRANRLLLLFFFAYLGSGVAAREVIQELEMAPLRGLRGPVAALLATGIEGGDLAMTGLAWQVVAATQERRAVFQLDGPVLELEVYAYAMRSDGQVHDFQARSVSWAGTSGAGLGVRITSSVGLPARQASLRVLVVEPRSLRYRLWVIAASELSEQPELPPNQAFLTRGAWQSAESSELPEMTESLESSDPVPELPSRKRKRRKILAERARQGYREALDRLASGMALPKAAEVLASVELKVYQDASTSGALVAHEAELDLAARLSRVDAEVLMPIALLYLEVFRHFVRREEHFLAELARRAAAGIAEDFAARSQLPNAGRLAAEVMLSLAADTTVRPERRRLLDRALSLAQRHDAVSLLVAATSEREGNHSEAVLTLEELLRRNPGLAEARLRLALNLSRIGRWAESESRLEGLLSDQHDDWVLAIAYQELARRRFEAGRGAAAVLLLRRGLSRLPAAPRLALQLAWMLDHQGESAAARHLVASVQVARVNDSPRHRYSGGSESALEQVHRSLTEQAQVRIAALFRALGALAVGE